MKRLVYCGLMSLMALAAVPSSVAGAVNETIFTYDKEGAETDLFGIQRLVRTDVAMLLKNPALVGYDIVGVSVDVPSKDGCSVEPVGTAFLTTVLQVEGEDNLPNLQEVSGEIVNYGTEEKPELRLDLTFDEPYTLTEAGVYVGYSLTVTACKTVSGWTSKYPIVTVCGIEAPESFMVHTNKGQSTLPQKYPEWTDLNPEKRQALAMRVILRGEESSPSAVLEAKQTLYVAPGQEGNVFMTLTNGGACEINSIEYSYTTPDGNKISGDVNLAEPLPATAGAWTTLDLSFVAPDVTGQYEIPVAVTKIDGKPVEDAQEMPLMMEVVPFLPVHRPLIEDYTGLWCGYCPEVYVMCHQMADKYGKDFLSMEYHVNDRVQSVATDKLPSDSYGLPKVYMGDRTNTINYADMESLWETKRRTLAPADVEVSLFWNDEEHTSLRAESKVKFVYSDPNAYYIMSYALVEDDMSSPDWMQRNYFYDKNMTGPYWDLFCGKSYNEAGIVYEGVIVNYPEPKGIAGSMPSDIIGGEVYNHDTILALADATCKYSADVNLYGKELIQDAGKLRVIALLIDGKTGNVCNAATTGYSADAPLYSENVSSVSDITDTTEPQCVEKMYYAIDGERLSSAPERGLYIKVSKMSDGTLKAQKVLR